MIFRRLVFVGFLFVIGAISVIGQKVYYDPHRLVSSERLIENFEQVVFHLEIGDEQNLAHVYKWQSPLRYILREEEAEKFFPALRENMTSLSLLSGLVFEVADKTYGRGNINLHFVPHVEMYETARFYHKGNEVLQRLVREGACIAVASPVDDVIVEDFIIISTDESDDSIRSCLLKGMARGLGLPNVSELIRPSIFSHHDEPLELTINDKILVRTLYDPRITPGMGKYEAMALAREIIPELVARVKAEGEEALYQSPGWRVQ